MKETDFNEIVSEMIGNAINAGAIRSEIEMHDSGYQLSITLIKLEDD